MELKELRKLSGLDEALDEKELASEMTKFLGLLRIQVQRIARQGKAAPKGQIGSVEYQLGYADCEKWVNELAKKSFKGVKKFRG